ncbi:hypothetical protein Nepgr_008351 [Nepenthes gracilis]|uniref:Uncharacterized protein n=1 Tax=Nepenthes gracilis TaxID=150966 RepID=A0AAD3XJC8_NEPGR|nr:hypothetical protein Nepgr_008351 [Nepenthes gracilis]
MTLGKMRGNKRSSSSTFFNSTLTTIVVIAMCVLGIWLLISDSVVTPQSTGRTSIAATTTTSYEKSVITTGSNDENNPHQFEDNPGELPEDAIKSDEPQKPQQEDQRPNDSEEFIGENTNDDTSNEGEEKNETRDTRGENDHDGGDAGRDESTNFGGKESVEELEVQNEGETRVSEESAVIQNQNIEKSSTDDSAELNPHDNEGNADEKSHNEEGGEHQDQVAESNNNNYQNAENQSGNDRGKIKDLTKQQQQENANQQQGKENKGDSEEENDSTQIHKQDAPTRSTDDKPGESNSRVSLPNTGIPKESNESTKSWSTQAAESNKEKERRKEKSGRGEDDSSIYGYSWQLCNVTAGQDYIPCLDNQNALKKLQSTKHFEHRERHCPEELPTCLVPLPEGYKKPIAWPTSRDKIWFHNVPRTELAEVKGHQNWVKVSGEFLTFPGGGTQFIHGALHYIDFLQQSVPGIAWGKHTRVILDVGCGVASFGGYLFDRDVLTMSFAPKDEHEAQVQFALERGIPAISAVMGSQRLPFPSGVFDLVHCARCRVPWHDEGGRLLLELNRVLRPGGHFVWSATPVYQKLREDVEIWEAMSSLTASMCWKIQTIKNDTINKIGAVIYRKPITNECYEKRQQDTPPLCKNEDDPNAAWYIPLQPCMHRVPVDKSERGSRWPESWSKRLSTPPYWLSKSQLGIYGKSAPDDFATDYEHWNHVVNKSYLNGLGISWSNVRNVMDMRAVYGGFAAALRDLQVWVLNVVNINSPDTLPIIYERGLFGIYHDWCEGFSTYPRTYDLLHADHLFSKLKERCKLAPVMAEIDRIVRPGGKLIVRDVSSAIGEVENLLKSLHWEVHLTFSKDQEGILSAQKSNWRPKTYASS